MVMTKHSRTTKSALAYISQMISMAVTVLGGFLITPLLLRLLGSERYGIFRIISDWVANLGLLELGLGGAIAVALLPAINQDDQQRSAKTLNEGFRACTLIGVLMISGAVILVGILPCIIPHQNVGSLEIRLAVLAFAVSLLAFPVSIFRTLFEVRQEGYLINALITIQAIVTLALQVLAASLHLGLAGVCLAATLGQIPMVTVLSCKAIGLFPKFWQAPVEPALRRRIWSVNWSVFLCTTMGRIGLFSDNLVVGNILGGSAVSSFYLTQRFATVAQMQLQGLGNATWAGLMDLAFNKDPTRFQKSFIELTSIVSGLGLAAFAPIAILNPFFFAKWMGHNLYAGPVVNALVCVSAWLWSIQSLWGWPIYASGNSRRFVPYAIVSAGLNLGVSIFATKWLGLPGPIIGTVVMFLLIHSWAMPKILKEIFQVDSLRLISAALHPLLWGIPCAILWKCFVTFFPPQNWPSLTGEALLIGASSLFLWWRVSCNQPSREQWRERLRAMPPQALSLIKSAKA